MRKVTIVGGGQAVAELVRSGCVQTGVGIGHGEGSAGAEDAHEVQLPAA